MMKSAIYLPFFVGVMAIISGCIERSVKDTQPTPAGPETQVIEKQPAGPSRANVTAQRLVSAAHDTDNWLSHGRSYSEQRYSPLTAISTENIDTLGLAWSTPLESFRGIEATPLVVDGVMYTTGSWSVVFALDARTGEKLWKYDPQVPREKGVHACCDVVNRGVAVYEGKVYVGTLDGRLVALEANSGEELWSTRTFETKEPRTITGAPRVVKDKVIIGHGGAEYGVRGFVAAYDVDTGEQEWKFYTVPGNPADGFENDTMKMAAETWKGEWWKLGGGGTVWDSMAYDPELDLLYIGVGNGSPWNQQVRSPGGGDNLFLSSIVALRPDTGEYVWHYQTTPGETWDFTATQSIILAELEIDRTLRKVLMQAPKNGFFYVIDRTNGKLISAEPFVPVNWAKSINLETGRPIENPEARYLDGPALVMPTPFGGHNWHPMSFSPETGLAYLSSQELPYLYESTAGTRDNPDGLNIKVSLLANEPPDTEAERRALIKQAVKGSLLAWDPVAQQEAWKVEYDTIWNGGTLATAGGLVFQGRSDQSFAAFDARTGNLLWQMPVGTGVVGGPITYEVDGEQYIAVSAGWGTIFNLMAGFMAEQKGGQVEGHMLSFKLGGEAQLDIQQPPRRQLPEPPEQVASEETIARGAVLYSNYCLICHCDGVISSGTTPDLRYSGTLGNDAFYVFVLEGISKRGMPNFNGRLAREEVEAVHGYVVDKAWAAWNDLEENQSGE